MACDPQLLADVELFEHVDAEDRARLAEFIDACQLAAGETLFKTGEPATRCTSSVPAKSNCSSRTPPGQKILLTIANPGEVFGELALLDRGPRTATALGADRLRTARTRPRRSAPAVPEEPVRRRCACWLR
jgi:CRP-like cAMP-binding protein